MGLEFPVHDQIWTQCLQASVGVQGGSDGKYMVGERHSWPERGSKQQRSHSPKGHIPDDPKPPSLGPSKGFTASHSTKMMSKPLKMWICGIKACTTN